MSDSVDIDANSVSNTELGIIDLCDNGSGPDRDVLEDEYSCPELNDLGSELNVTLLGNTSIALESTEL